MDPEQVLAMAIEKEKEAHELYAGVAERTKDPAVRTLLGELAAEEASHRATLTGLTPEAASAFKAPVGRDLNIAEYLEPKPLGPESGLQDALIHAMKREEEARAFYQAMAGAVSDHGLRSLLRELAAMENGHKARLEAFYEDVFLREN